jgi:hypothetical protein
VSGPQVASAMVCFSVEGTPSIWALSKTQLEMNIYSQRQEPCRLCLGVAGIPLLAAAASFHLDCVVVARVVADRPLDCISPPRCE